MLAEHDALATPAGRATFRELHGIGRTTMSNWRARSGSNPTTCLCGAPLPGTRRRRCDECLRAAERQRHVTSTYGLTADEYQALVERADGRCEVCRQAPATEGPPTVRHLHVDHDHATGVVRGLLCHGCNSALGACQDDADRLRALADYIERA